MADALGGELAEADRPLFEGHLAMCATCRDEYRSLVGAVDQMRSLPGSIRISEEIVREAGPVIATRVGRSGVFVKYAASVLLAFGGGYAFHGGTSPVLPVVAPVVTETAEPSRTTLETALVSAHRKKPGGSGLSIAMAAMFSGD